MSVNTIKNPANSVSWPAFKAANWNAAGNFDYIAAGNTVIFKYPNGFTNTNNHYAVKRLIAFVAVFNSGGGDPAELIWAGFIGVPDSGVKLFTLTGSTSTFTVAMQDTGIAITAGSTASNHIKGLWMY